MREANPRLTEEQARHLTMHGAQREEDGSYRWKFDNHTRAVSPYLFNVTDARDIWGRITLSDLAGARHRVVGERPVDRRPRCCVPERARRERRRRGALGAPRPARGVPAITREFLGV